MLISIVIPCYRSERTLPAVIDEIRDAFEKHPEHRCQLVLVNDGSPDNTYQTICRLCKENSNIVGIDLSRNYGQARARLAALPYVKGDCVVYMDDDGQHPAEGIFHLVEKIEEGYDVVYAKFKQKKHTMFKRMTSDLFGKIQVFLNVTPKGISKSSFFAWSNFVVDALKDYHSPSPAVAAYLLKITSRFVNVEMPHRERLEGKSGYTLGKLIDLAIMSLTGFTTIPFRMIAGFGVVLASIGCIMGLVLGIWKLLNPAHMVGIAFLIAIAFMLGGGNFIVLGVLGEYIGVNYMVLNDMPQFLIREVVTIEDNSTVPYCGNELHKFDGEDK